MRDWSTAFRRASFRGVPFWVEAEAPAVGRRVAEHPISGGEAVLTEDMGAAARTVTLDAYVSGDGADGAGLSLEAACAAFGAATLVLPMGGPGAYHCTGCERNRRRDRNGFVAYRLEFVAQGGGAASAASGISLVRSAFASGLSGAVTAFAGALS